MVTALILLAVLSGPLRFFFSPDPCSCFFLSLAAIVRTRGELLRIGSSPLAMG